MTQGQHKPSSSSLIMSKTKKKTAHRGIRIAPKNTGLIAQKKIQRKLASRNISHTESIMAGRAGATGKLTIMKKVGEGALEKLREKKEKK